jgi:glycerol-3-phosphate acyltransferase PlsY
VQPTIDERLSARGKTGRDRAAFGSYDISVSTSIALLLIVLAAYLIGAVPFGYVIGRLKGKNLFHEGSGNIGATNAGRVLGRPYGIAVFVLDFLKGAGPTFFAPQAYRMLTGLSDDPFGYAQLHQVAAAAASFLGHLFPIYLGFKGGKGVATGAGAALVVAPLPALLAVLTWITVVLASRMVSLASLLAAAVIIGSRVILQLDEPMERAIAGTLFCVIGGLFVIVKHRSNVKRIIERRENQIAAAPNALAGWHLLALGLAFGGSAFFNFVTAPAIFQSFEEVVRASKSDRTANIALLPDHASDDDRKALASALAGAAVGPVFPKYFAMLVIGGSVALITSLPWRSRGLIHKRRTALLLAALIVAMIGWPLSAYVSQLRLERFATDPQAAAQAKSLFGPVHLASLGLSAIGTFLNGLSLGLAGRIPKE